MAFGTIRSRAHHDCLHRDQDPDFVCANLQKARRVTMFRSAARSSFRSSRQAVARRTYVTGHHTSAMPQTSDMPWVIGSALVFVPLFFSLTSPPGVHAQTHATSPTKEGLHEDVPAARKATQAEEPAEKEPSPSAAAADKAESEGESSSESSKPQEAAVATSTTRHDAKDVGEAAKESQQNVQASGDDQRAGTEEARAAVEDKKEEKKKDEVSPALALCRLQRRLHRD